MDTNGEPTYTIIIKYCDVFDAMIISYQQNKLDIEAVLDQDIYGWSLTYFIKCCKNDNATESISSYPIYPSFVDIDVKISILLSDMSHNIPSHIINHQRKAIKTDLVRKY